MSDNRLKIFNNSEKESDATFTDKKNIQKITSSQ